MKKTPSIRKSKIISSPRKSKVCKQSKGSEMKFMSMPEIKMSSSTSSKDILEEMEKVAQSNRCTADKVDRLNDLMNKFLKRKMN
jgi:hypothetical protein